MDGMLSNIPGHLKEGAGLALFGLSAIDSLQTPGGLQNLLRTRALLTQDPGARAALQGSPFLSGALGFTGGFAPETPPGIAATRMQQAGIAPGTFVPSMGRLNPETFVASRLAGAQAQALSDPDVMAQAARHSLGIPPPGLTPDQISASRETLGPGETLQVPMAGGARETLRGRFGPGAAPYGYMRDDVTGRLVRDPRIPGAKAGGGEEAVNTEFKLWRSTHPKATYDDYARDKARAAGAATAAREEVKLATLTSTTRTMIETAPSVKSLVAKIQRDMAHVLVGPFAGRWQELWAGKIGERDPGFIKLRDEMGLLTTALQRMHVGARGGDAMFDHFRDLLGQGEQAPENMQAALSVIDGYADDKLAERTGAQQQLQQRSRLGPQTPEPASGAAPGSDQRTRQLDQMLFGE